MFKKLRIFNLLMAVLHFIQGVLMVVLSKDFSLPIKTSFLMFNENKMALMPNYQTLIEVQIGPLVASFLFMSAVAHLIVSLPNIYEWYVKNLKQHINIARWIEYSFSSSVMIVIICMLVGIYDFVTLLSIFFLNAGMILFGWVMEKHNQVTKKTDWLSYIFGCVLGIIPWIGVALYLIGSGEGDAKPPTFVYYIFFSMFIFFNTFAINMYLQYKEIGPWKNYLYGEKMYIVLSLVAKSLLAWQVWAGTLRPV